MPTVAQLFAHTLKEIGVRYVFGVPSGNMTDYIEALRNEPGIDFILVGNETTAAFMAGVCGRLTGIPGVCFGTFGPGATNLTTGVGGAFLDRFPMIAFTDEMPEYMRDRIVQMNIDHQVLFKSITKWTSRIGNDNVNEIILQAAGIAVDEVPGPVHLGIPAGIGLLRAEESEKSVQYLRLKKELSQQIPDDEMMKAKLLFFKAEKPVVAVGLSAVRAGVQDKILQLAEKFQIPVVVTPMAKGIFPEKHALYAGVLFHALSDKVAKIYTQADLVIGIGYDPVEFNYEQWIPEVPLIHFDSQTADIDREEFEVVVDVKGELNELLTEFLKMETGKKKWDLNQLTQVKSEIQQKLKANKDKFEPLTVVEELRKSLPEEGILTVDVGAHLHLVGQMWITPSPEKLLMTNGWSSMGFAVPAALAAKLCYPDLPVAAIMGDGGFYMTVGELATAKRLKLNIVFIVIYDKSLSLIRIKQEKRYYDSQYGTDLGEIPENPTNHYFGVPVIRATSISEYREALKGAFSSNSPVVIEALVDGSEYDDLVLKPNK